jgi:hypothetical protein
MKGKVIADFKAEHPGELSIKEGESVDIVTGDEGDGWTKCSYNGQVGIVPSTYVKTIQTEKTTPRKDLPVPPQRGLKSPINPPDTKESKPTRTSTSSENTNSPKEDVKIKMPGLKIPLKSPISSGPASPHDPDTPISPKKVSGIHILQKVDSKSGMFSPRKSEKTLEKKDSIISAPQKVETVKVQSDLTDEELAKLFTEVVDQMNVKDPKKRQQLFDLPREHKLTMIGTNKERTGTSLTVEKAIKGIKDESKAEAKAEKLREISVHVKTAPVKWALDFIKAGGFTLLSSVLASTNIIAGQSRDFGFSSLFGKKSTPQKKNPKVEDFLQF